MDYFREDNIEVSFVIAREVEAPATEHLKKNNQSLALAIPQLTMLIK